MGSLHKMEETMILGHRQSLRSRLVEGNDVEDEVS